MNYKIEPENCKMRLENMTSSILEFTDILSQSDFFSREFYMIMSLQTMSDYIFKNCNSDKYCSFLIESAESFLDVFNFKRENRDKISTDENIKKEYKKLSRKFLKYQNYFYSNIYESRDDKNFIEDMIKVLNR